MQTYEEVFLECLHNNDKYQNRNVKTSLSYTYFRNVIYFLKTVTKWVKLSNQYVSEEFTQPVYKG